MNTFSFAASTVLVALVLASSTGCRAEAEAASDTNQGLTLDIHEAEHVAGRFTHDGSVLAFDFALHGAAREATLRRETGEPILTSTVSADGVETMRVLGGRMVVSGVPSDPEPRSEGDHQAAVEMNEMPEMKLVAPLREALASAGVSRALFAPIRPSGLSIKANMNQWYTLGCKQSQTFPTWSFWSITTLSIVNRDTTNAFFSVENPYTTDKEYLFQPPTAVTGAIGNRYPRQYWAFPMKVTNLCGWGGSATISAMVR